ncbi:unnamed protein product [Lactuca virosa]|uniref:25S rRNA (uridine-N(3))-methyltransferase BMT5-like domain-containing protein n=1 Tax=Lactuca virosa TaxID=75947 RepID=A0AAU9MJD9_9ASTR|nr:unnamed protein product [Lactuca virosa]
MQTTFLNLSTPVFLPGAFFLDKQSVTMAEMIRTHERSTSVNGNDELGEAKWAKHYSSIHQILLVEEGDFSFSLSLEMSFGSAFNIVASSLDSSGNESLLL